MTGTHVGCEHGVCGACTVLVDGCSARGCLMLAVQAEGRDVGTVEGLARPDGSLHPIQQAFHELHGLQCGFCTPGILMSVAELLAHEPDPDEAQIRDVLSGHLCRCTGYQNIVDAVRLAARLMRGERMSGVGPVGPWRPPEWGGHAPDRDAALLRGEARFLDDSGGDAIARLFRAQPHAHARIVSIDLSAARAMPSVAAACGGGSLWRADGMAHAAGIRAGRSAGQHAVRAGLVGSRVRRRGRGGGVGRQPASGRGRGGGGRVDYEALAAVADAAPRSTRIAARAQRAGIEPAAALRWNTGIARPRSPGRPGCSPSASGRIAAPRIRWKGAACWRRRTRPAMR